MSQELTDAEWLKGLVAQAGFDMDLGGRTAISEGSLARLRAIAAKLERGAVECDATYCGNRLVCIHVDRREGDDFRTMHHRKVAVTINPV